MQVLLSSIGSRGDVQPILALALELQALGHRARLCVAPNFKDWIESYGVACTPIGPDLQKMTGGSVPGKPVLPPLEVLQKLADDSVREQFRVIGAAARGCDLIVAAGALQIAARSIAESQHIPYLFAAYCPAVLPSASYPPPKMGGHYAFTLPEAENLRLWQEDEDNFQARFGAVLNEERAQAGLPPVTSVQQMMFTERPWLAADPLLGPALPLDGMAVTQTGAWMLAEPAARIEPESPLVGPAPLPEAVEQFLAGGAPPIYLGFGSMRAAEQTGPVLVAAARAVGRRALLSQGWAGLTASAAADDCLTLGEINHAALFPRVAAVVHHGGAGTTHTAARAGAPQVIIPHNYDQFYWGYRVQQLGAGVSGPLRDELTVDGLAAALRDALRPQVAAQAQSLAGRIEPHGARIAAERLTEEFG